MSTTRRYLLKPTITEADIDAIAVVKERIVEAYNFSDSHIVTVCRRVETIYNEHDKSRNDGPFFLLDIHRTDRVDGLSEMIVLESMSDPEFDRLFEYSDKVELDEYVVLDKNGVFYFIHVYAGFSILVADTVDGLGSFESWVTYDITDDFRFTDRAIAQSSDYVKTKLVVIDKATGKAVSAVERAKDRTEFCRLTDPFAHKWLNDQFHMENFCQRYPQGALIVIDAQGNGSIATDEQRSQFEIYTGMLPDRNRLVINL